MVLWNHWHGNHSPTPVALNVDTTFFYMISGFTTASQLRIQPEIAVEQVEEVASNGEKKQIEKMKLTPRSDLNLTNFYLIRAVGLYPIMWLALIIHAPIWYEQDKYQFPNHVAGLHQEKESATCTFLYVIGMNVWSQACTRRGPDVRFASGLIINLLFYGALRYLWTKRLNASVRGTNVDEWVTKTKGLVATPKLMEGKDTLRD
jgi:hypothetical protein